MLDLRAILGATPQGRLGARMRIFDTLEDLNQSRSIWIGMYARVLGRHTKGDPGNNVYEIVPASTGTDNGGDYIDLSASGYQAKGLFPGQIVNVWQYGGGTGTQAVDDAALAAMLLADVDHNTITHSGLCKRFEVNISNAANTTSVSATTDTPFPLVNDGANSFQTSNVTSGKLWFDPTFNGGTGGIIVDGLKPESGIYSRITYVCLGGGNTNAVLKLFLVFDKTDPGTGVSIVTSPQEIRQGVEQSIDLYAFHDGIEAIYPVINSDGARDYQLNGFDVVLFENQ
jgi:hypothetical protein